MNFIIIIIIAIISGIGIGLLGVRVYSYIMEKMLQKKGKEVLEGLRENVMELDGKKINVNKFKVDDEKGNKMNIYFGNNKNEEEK